MNIDTAYIRGLLDIPDHAPSFTGDVMKRNVDHQFADTECDECFNAGAVYVEYVVDDPDEGLVKTDAMFCGAHAGEGVRCILDRADRSIDHDTDVTVNYWAVQYQTFPAAKVQEAA
jgi:hypothetical protein